MPEVAQRIASGPPARAALVRGIDKMTALLRPTLGPLPRTVAIARIVSNQQPPEILDNAALIARRTIQLADPFEDMGGMLVRHLVWRVFDQVGDGTATAAVLAQSLVHAGAKYIAAGGNPVSVRRGMQLGLTVAQSELRRQARAIDGPADIAGAVAGAVGDSKLAEMIGEVVDAVGPDGSIQVEDAQGTETVVEYIDGVRWNEGYLSSFLLKPNESTSTKVLNPRVLVTDFAVEHVEHLLPTLEACVAAGDRALFVVAPEVRDSAIGLLVANRERGVMDGAVAVKAPSFGHQRAQILEDIAIITGGRCVRQDSGRSLAGVTIDDLGKARHAWATNVAFGILGGQGSKAAIRQRIAEAKVELSMADDDSYTRDKIRERIGKLAGTAAIVRVGAPTRGEQEELKLRIEAVIKSARSGLQDGVVPGGGAALLACVPALEGLEVTGDEAVGVRALAHALSEPMRSILVNAGFDPGPIVAQARQRPPCVFDVVRREWVNAWSAGIVDPLAVALTVVEASVSVATTALTGDVLVRRKKPPMATQP